jgi:leader peptidase (prepilin peptidase)/N-methyltransferase
VFLPLVIFFGALGAIFASFSGVLAERVHTGQSWWKGRSRCNSCRRLLNGLDLVPILSWSFQKGRCRVCGARVAITYTLYEIALAVVFALSYIKLGLTLALGIFLLAAVTIGFIVLYDLRHTIIPVWSMVLLGVLAVLYALLTQDTHTFLYTLGIGAIIGIGFLLLHVLSRGKAMGLGDAPVAFALSILVGYGQAVPGILFSFWIGALIGVILLVAKRTGTTMKSEIPFVPFLAAGYLLAFFTGWNPLIVTF